MWNEKCDMIELMPVLNPRVVILLVAAWTVMVINNHEL